MRKGKSRWMLLFLLTALCVSGCGRRAKKPGTKDSPTVTEEATPAYEVPSGPFTEYFAGSIAYIYEDSNGRAWLCPGELRFEGGARGKAYGNVWRIAEGFSFYVLENEEGAELFRIERKGENYILHIGMKEVALPTAASGETELTIETGCNRTVFMKNGELMFSLISEIDAMILCIADGDKATAYRFPVTGSVVRPFQGDVCEKGMEELLPGIRTLEDIYDGSYLAGFVTEVISAVPHEERPADYVQITRERVTANGVWTQYDVLYQANSVLVDRTTSADSTTITEYAFRNLSEGTDSVEYYTYKGAEEQLQYTFSVDQLDTFRSTVYGEEDAGRAKLSDVFHNLQPLLLEKTELGFMEKGTCSEGRYVRFLYCNGPVFGELLAGYAPDGTPLGVAVKALGEGADRIYAEGTIAVGDKPVRSLTVRSYDSYGALVKEVTADGTVHTIEYEFTDLAFGEADDMVRHEWRSLMPYLEKSPKFSGEEQSVDAGDMPEDSDGDGKDGNPDDSGDES